MPGHHAIATGQITSEIGSCWTCPVDTSAFGFGDTVDTAACSALVVFEDDKPLGPPHAQHETIRSTGMGAYSHWNDTLFFSTSDNSDPRINGRQYRIFRDA